MPEDITQPVIRYHQEVLSDHHIELVSELFAADFVNEATGFPPVNGADAMRELVQSLLDGFPDYHSTIEDMMTVDDKVIVRWSMSGTHNGVFQNIPPTGTQVNVGGIHIDIIQQQKIVKRWAYNSFPVVIQALRAREQS